MKFLTQVQKRLRPSTKGRTDSRFARKGCAYSAPAFVLGLVRGLISACHRTRCRLQQRVLWADSKGFSLIETVVAIAILSVAMVGPLSLAQRGLNASLYARDQVTAFYLAQEAIEHVHNVRDSNNLANLSGSNNWLSGLDNCKNKTCGIDGNFSPSTIVCSANPQNCRLVFNLGVSGTPSTGIYGEYGLRANPDGTLPGGWKSTIFTRTLQINPVTVAGDPNAEADLVAVVTWSTGSISKSITVSEKIFNWYPAPAL